MAKSPGFVEAVVGFVARRFYLRAHHGLGCAASQVETSGATQAERRALVGLHPRFELSWKESSPSGLSVEGSYGIMKPW